MKIKIVLAMFILLFNGCSNAEEKINNKAITEIDRGNYIKATYLLNSAIKINPNYLDGMVNYRNVYPSALNQANERIKEYQKVEDYKQEAYAYEDLLKLKNNYYYADDIVHQKLGMSLELPTIEEIYQLKNTMGEVYYKAGVKLENRPLNRMEKRERYYLYERGVELSPKYKDIVKLREKSYKEALVKVMIEMSDDTPYSYKNNLKFQISGNIANEKKKKLIRIIPLKSSLLNEGWNKNKVNGEVNTGIKIDYNYLSVTPLSVQKSVTPITWYEERLVQTKDGPKVKSLGRTYFQHNFYKTQSVKVSFTYIMKDLSTGEILGSGTFIGTGVDSYKWSRFSGDLPNGQSSGSFERKLKSKEELIDLAFADAISKLSKDISKKI